jgi:dihydrolipoamide dehydrogenase
LLPELTLALKWDLTTLEAVRNVHTHPTLSEAVQGPSTVKRAT